MNEFKVFDDLEILLKNQIELFDAVIQKQNLILQTLTEEIDFSRMMTLLSEKEEIVTQISLNSKEHKPFIADWMQRKQELGQDPRYHRIESFLDIIANRVESIQEQDEKMMEFFNSQKNSQADQDPQNLLNAYRGLR